MQFRYVLDEPPQCREHVSQGLTRARLGKEDHKVDRMADMEGDADFGVALEAADAGAVPGARINDDDRRLCRVDTVVPALVASLRDTQQGIVGGLLELARIEDHLGFEVEQRRQAGLLMLQHGVGALPQRVEEQDRPLQNVALIRQEVERRHHCSRLRLGRSLRSVVSGDRSFAVLGRRGLAPCVSTIFAHGQRQIRSVGCGTPRVGRFLNGHGWLPIRCVQQTS